MLTFHFPRDEKKLEDFHSSMQEKIAIKPSGMMLYYSGGHPTYKVVYKSAFDGLQYRVIYDNQFEFVNEIVGGQVVPKTIFEKVYDNDN